MRFHEQGHKGYCVEKIARLVYSALLPTCQELSLIIEGLVQSRAGLEVGSSSLTQFFFAATKGKWAADTFFTPFHAAKEENEMIIYINLEVNEPQEYISRFIHECFLTAVGAKWEMKYA